MIENHVIASQELSKLKQRLLQVCGDTNIEAHLICKSPLVEVPSVKYRLAQINSACKAVKAILEDF
jgi:hypothetical protein